MILFQNSFFKSIIAITALIKLKIQNKNILLLTPVFGILLFIFLYFIATLFYPGGSQLDKNSNGFSWAQNYWCNLLNENAINTQPNPARPIAMSAMFILCVSLLIFWYIFPRQIDISKSLKLTIQVSGFASMAIGIFLFSGLHDIIVNLATLAGIIAVTGTIAGLKKLNWIKLFWMGIFNTLLVVLNNILYYGDGLLFYLPIVQKFTFLFFLLWISLVNIKLYNHGKSNFNKFV